MRQKDASEEGMAGRPGISSDRIASVMGLNGHITVITVNIPGCLTIKTVKTVAAP